MLRFFLIIGGMLLLDVLWWWLADRRVRRLRHAALWRTLVGIFALGQLGFIVGMIVAPEITRRSHHVLPTPVHAAVYLWHLIVLPASMLLMGGWALLKLPFRFLSKKQPHAATSIAQGSDEAEVPRLTRRQVLGAAAAALPPLVTMAAVGKSLATLDDLRVRRVELLIPSLPRELDGVTLAHITDSHVGKFTRTGHLKKVAELANSLKADLHLLTGDLIDLSVADLPAALDFVQALDPKCATYMCEGNHDLIENPLEFYRQCKARDIPLLIDQQKIAHPRGLAAPPIQVMGMRWGWPQGGRGGGSEEQMQGAVERLVPQRRADAFPILLAHHPHAFDPAAAAGFPLTLAGHTHGGMLMLRENVGPATLMYRYYSGPYRKGDSHVVVSNGVGCWFPLRLNAPQEISHITLRAG